MLGQLQAQWVRCVSLAGKLSQEKDIHHVAGLLVSEAAHQAMLVGTALNELVLSWWRAVEVRITQPRAKTVETDSRHPVALPLIEPAG